MKHENTQQLALLVKEKKKMEKKEQKEQNQLFKQFQNDLNEKNQINQHKETILNQSKSIKTSKYFSNLF